MELSTINKLYLELSQITTAKTENEIRLEKLHAINNDQKIVSEIVLRGSDNQLCEISSGLTSDFVRNTNTFNIKEKNGDEFMVTIKISKI